MGNIEHARDLGQGIYTQAQADSLLATKEPADATILKQGDIGTSVLAPNGDGSQLTGLQGVDSGFILVSPTNTIPSGYLECNGTSLSTTTYSSLFSVIGYTYGGSGSSFNLPDLRGEFIRGWDNGRGVDSGRIIGSFQDERVGSKGMEDWAERRSPYAYGNLSMNVFAPKISVHPNYGGNTNLYRGNLTPSQIGETRPRNIAMMYCIKY